MNYTLTKGIEEDYEDIIDFGNYVFGIDFISLLPKLYKNHKEVAQHHHLIKEGHRIKAMVGSFPLGFRVCNDYLKIRGIGTVSVHKYSRGSGYMKLLMDTAIIEMKEEGCDLAILSGQRQRYEYWGFTPCGINIIFNFNSSNIKHTKIHTEDIYEFTEYDEKASCDLEKIIDLHESQIAHGIRATEAFLEICKSWNNNLIFIYKNQEFSGYICSSTNSESISEIMLLDPSEIDTVLTSYMKYFNLKNASVAIYMHRTEEFIKLSRLCEHYMIKNSANMYIINYINVIKSFMNLKNTFSPLCEGVLILNVLETGTFSIEVKNGVVTVLETDLPHHISLSPLDATALLFSHGSFINSTYTITNPLVKSWFPLPLFYPEIDNV